jgi:hypothetical protein
MKLYQVQSGGIDGFFKASSPEEAFLRAMRRVQRVVGKPIPMPGLILRVREVADDLKQAGKDSEWVYYNPLELIKKL